MKTEEWNNHIIRFVQNNGEWVGISKYKGTQKVCTLIFPMDNETFPRNWGKGQNCPKLYFCHKWWKTITQKRVKAIFHVLHFSVHGNLIGYFFLSKQWYSSIKKGIAKSSCCPKKTDSSGQ